MAANQLVTLAQLQALCMTEKGRQACAQYLAPLNAAMHRFQINTPPRVAMFLAQIAHESADFTSVSESLYYSDPKRVAEIFRSGFDLNKNGAVDAAEIEFAKGYTRNSEKLANRAYANRYGNGDEASGDGYRYRGAGLKQLTFKANHQEFGDSIGLALHQVPDYLRKPEGAALSAAWFWSTRGLNALADAGKYVQITTVINGGQTGAPSRAAYLARIQKAMKA